MPADLNAGVPLYHNLWIERPQCADYAREFLGDSRLIDTERWLRVEAPCAGEWFSLGECSAWVKQTAYINNGWNLIEETKRTGSTPKEQEAVDLAFARHKPPLAPPIRVNGIVLLSINRNRLQRFFSYQCQESKPVVMKWIGSIPSPHFLPFSYNTEFTFELARCL